jgi:hypothetical protein
VKKVNAILKACPWKIDGQYGTQTAAVIAAPCAEAASDWSPGAGEGGVLVKRGHYS